MSLNLTKQDLENWSILDNEMLNEFEKLKELHESLTTFASVNINSESANKSPNDRVACAVCTLMSFNIKLVEMIIKNMAKQKAILDKVDQIEDSKVKTALIMRYWRGWSWGKVAANLGGEPDAIRKACKKKLSFS